MPRSQLPALVTVDLALPTDCPAPTNQPLVVNTTCGASNVSFGLPNRHHVTGTFLAMAIGAGMTSAIMSPLHDEVRTAIQAADVLAGHDTDCAAWIRAHRDPTVGADRERRGRRHRPQA